MVCREILLNENDNAVDTYKDLDQITPIKEGTIALPHSPVYKMHRYFARRP